MSWKAKKKRQLIDFMERRNQRYKDNPKSFKSPVDLRKEEKIVKKLKEDLKELENGNNDR